VSRAGRRFPILLCPLVLLAACAPGNRLTIPGELSRPAKARVSPAGPAQAVVLDFSYSAQEPGIVGRDFDGVRPIGWAGNPGKAMADLVAGILSEGGVAVVRAGAEGPDTGNVPVRISGVVRRFEVNARRPGGVKVVTEATVSLTVTAAGGSLSGPVSHAAMSSNSMEDVFVTPDDARQALFSSANAAAEEVARRLLEAGVVSPSLPGK